MHSVYIIIIIKKKKAEITFLSLLEQGKSDRCYCHLYIVFYGYWKKKREMRASHLHLQRQIFLTEFALPQFWYQVLEPSGGQPLVKVATKPGTVLRCAGNDSGSRPRWCFPVPKKMSRGLSSVRECSVTPVQTRCAPTSFETGVQSGLRCNCSIKALLMCYYNFYPSEKGVEGPTDEGFAALPSLSRRFPAHSVIMEMECLYL